MKKGIDIKHFSRNFTFVRKGFSGSSIEHHLMNTFPALCVICWCVVAIPLAGGELPKVKNGLVMSFAPIIWYSKW